MKTYCVIVNGYATLRKIGMNMKICGNGRHIHGYYQFTRSVYILKAATQYVPRLANLVFCSQGSLLDHDRCFRVVLENRHR